jgi:hypothetical protein
MKIRREVILKDKSYDDNIRHPALSNYSDSVHVLVNIYQYSHYRMTAWVYSDRVLMSSITLSEDGQHLEERKITQIWGHDKCSILSQIILYFSRNLYISKRAHSLYGKPAYRVLAGIACLFICSLFNDAVSSWKYSAAIDTIIVELERMWKEAVVT